MLLYNIAMSIETINQASIIFAKELINGDFTFEYLNVISPYITISNIDTNILQELHKFLISWQSKQLKIA